MQIRAQRRIDPSHQFLFFLKYFLLTLRRRSPFPFFVRLPPHCNSTNPIIWLIFLFICNPAPYFLRLCVTSIFSKNTPLSISYLLVQSFNCQRNVHLMHSNLYFPFALQPIFPLYFSRISYLLVQSFICKRNANLLMHSNLYFSFALFPNCFLLYH